MLLLFAFLFFVPQFAAAQCGEGLITPPAEQCDSQNLDGQSCVTLGYDGGTLSCSGACLFDTSSCYKCGDGATNPGEECDDSNIFPNDACTGTCQNAVCGDGVIRQFIEECDDSNTINGDGCSQTCLLENIEQCFAPIDVMLVIDRSTSMSTVEGGNTRIENAKSAAISFLNFINSSKDQVGLASFATTATLDNGLVFNCTCIFNAITNLAILSPPPQRTNLGEGVKAAQDEIFANGRENVTHVMVVLSDGAPNEMLDPPINTNCIAEPTSPTPCTDYALNQSIIAKDDGTIIFTIGLGVSNFTQSLLMQMASSPQNFYTAVNSTVLEDIYTNISQQICPCGNGDIDVGEECDDGNLFDYDNCTNSCHFPLCGDSIIRIGVEECDDGNSFNNDACQNCQLTYCGDAVLQNPNGAGTGGPLNDGNEECDDGNTGYFDSCLNNCVFNICGDGYVNIGVEECDDGNLINGDGCDANCEKESICGNGILENGEECDDGNLIDEDGCSSQCVTEFCGDNILQSGLSEVCELPSTINNAFCSQATSTCFGNKTGTRDGFGDCDSFCGCIFDAFTYQCTPGECGAECDSNDDCDDHNTNTIDSCDTDSCACLNIPKDVIKKDAKISSALPNSNFGLGRYMAVNPKSGGKDRSYIRIDASIYGGQEVSSAALKVAVYYTGYSVVSEKVDAYYCPSHDFNETTITWNNQPIDASCSLADTYNITTRVIAGIPETWHEFNITQEMNNELLLGDGKFTIVLKSRSEGSVSDNSRYVIYLSKEYSDEKFRPKVEII